ncbi:GntR family transcriptional regulator [Patulibacter americanus]|uniref:GntR family transcriptional regulator n=1 Tax=Patulibacter americanus TaxID=588672 RepID=UPI0003B6FA32|nr:GntR family transcriptional regulator [Patulibacter americanus]
MADPTDPGKRSPSERVYVALRDAVIHGDVAPGEPLRPQELATGHAVSLAAVREALLRLVGEGLAERHRNRGFAVPTVDAGHWRRVAEARAVVEPAMLRLAIERGDLEWEVRVRAAYHRLAGTPPATDEEDRDAADAWSEAHRTFHRTLLDACENDVLLATFDRLWVASELARRWFISRLPGDDRAGEHLALERAALARDTDAAADLLVAHVGQTVDQLARTRHA